MFQAIHFFTVAIHASLFIGISFHNGKLLDKFQQHLLVTYRLAKKDCYLNILALTLDSN